VDLQDFEGNTGYAEYNMFGVMSEKDKYELNLGKYSGMKCFCYFTLRCESAAVQQTVQLKSSVGFAGCGMSHFMLLRRDLRNFEA